MRENWIFTKIQLKTMLLGCGYAEVVGFDLQGSDLDEVSYFQALNELMKMKLVSSDGERFIGSSQMKSIAHSLACSPAFLAVHTGVPMLPDYCCYPGDPFVIGYVPPHNLSCIAVRFSSADTFLHDLRDEGYYPPETETCALEQERLETFENEAFRAFSSVQPISDASPVAFAAELIRRDGRLLGCVRVVNYYLYPYLYCFDGEKTERLVYSHSALELQIRRMLQ